MKLQKRANRKIGDKEYVKWYVNIPVDKIKELNWKEGIELEIQTKGNQVVLKPKSKS